MAPDLEAARALVDLGAVETALLTGRDRPIVLARRRRDARVAGAVAPRSAELGVMLPYSPLHHLLLADVGEPLVMTSGNLSDEPIAYDDDDARRAAGADRRPRAPPRPADPDPRRRLGAARGRGPAAAAAALTRRRPQPARAARARRPARAGLRRRAQEHVLPGARAPRLGLPPHRRPQDRGDARLLPGGRAPLRAPVRGHPRGRGARPPSRLPLHDLRTRARRRRARCGPAPPRPPRGVPGRARRAGAGRRRHLRRDRPGHRRHGLGRRDPGRRPALVRARRPPVAGPAAGRGPGRARAVADGLRVAEGGRRRAAAGRDRLRALARGRAAGGDRPGGAGHHLGRPAVRRHERALRPAHRGHLRGPGGDRARGRLRSVRARRLRVRRRRRRARRAARHPRGAPRPHARARRRRGRHAASTTRSPTPRPTTARAWRATAGSTSWCSRAARSRTAGCSSAPQAGSRTPVCACSCPSGCRPTTVASPSARRPLRSRSQKSNFAVATSRNCKP